MRCILQSIHGIRQGHSLGWLEVGKEITSNRYSPKQQLLLHLLQHVLTPRALVSMRKYTKLCSILFNLERQHGCWKRKSYICIWLGSVMFPNRRCIDRILHHRPILTMELGTSTNIGIYSGCTGWRFDRLNNSFSCTVNIQVCNWLQISWVMLECLLNEINKQWLMRRTENVELIKINPKLMG